MHAMYFAGPMFLVGLILHLTLILTLAFFVLFAAQKAAGLVKLLGNIIGIWLLALCVLIVVGHLTAPMFGGRIFGMMPMMDRRVEVRVTTDNSSELPPSSPAAATTSSNTATTTSAQTSGARAGGAHP